jgi:hypothetical protein
MSVAFAQFDEPLAWLIRGLIEYGWVDVSRGSAIPPGTVGGFDLSFIPTSQARSGLLLRVPATAGGQRHSEDDTYIFEVQLTSLNSGSGFTVRCANCNYLQEFGFDPGNPGWAAGYIHQGLSEYVPEYVRWRMGGGELTWAQRQGVPEVDSEPCTASLATWIGQQLSQRQTFDTNLWGAGKVATGPLIGDPNTPLSPIATVGNHAGASGRGQSPADAVRATLNGPANALMAAIGIGGIGAALALLNILVTIALFGVDRMFAVITSMGFAAIASVGAVGAWFGVKQYKQMRGNALPWVAIIYPSILPICCFAGLPLSIWAAIRWQAPAVKAIRATRQ